MVTMRRLTVLNHPGSCSGEDWEFLTEEFSEDFGYAAEFYDRYDHRHCEFALAAAARVLDGSSPEDVVRLMAGTAYFMLNPLVEEERKEFSAETRAQLERIRDSHPEFGGERVVAE